MIAFDASSIVHGWDHYPIRQFPKVWDWLGEKVSLGEAAICQVALEEVEKVDFSCHGWLRLNDITVIEITEEVLQHALAIKKFLGISDNDFGKNGVGHNDLVIISSAKFSGRALISNEAKQVNKDFRSNPHKCKIPLVCSLPMNKVECTSFLDYLKEAGQIFA